MAQTIQSISLTQYTASSLDSVPLEEPEDNVSLMYSMCDSLNNLYITLEKLYHVMTMKNIELRIKQNEKEKAPSFEGDVSA